MCVPEFAADFHGGARMNLTAFQAGAWNEVEATSIPGRSLERGIEKPPSFSREGGWGMSFCANN